MSHHVSIFDILTLGPKDIVLHLLRIKNVVASLPTKDRGASASHNHPTQFLGAEALSWASSLVFDALGDKLPTSRGQVRREKKKVPSREARAQRSRSPRQAKRSECKLVQDHDSVKSWQGTCDRLINSLKLLTNQQKDGDSPVATSL